MNLSLVTALILLSACTALADSKTVTFFADGAMVDIEAAAQKGIASIPLPHGMLDGSLRIKPLGGASLQRVDILPLNRESKTNKELDNLLERKSRLEDRLRALATREEVFTSAAKSQSGKAPRKTKSNPDPLQSIRQGTDFAIAQLEAVYTARRKTVQEIRSLDAKIAELRAVGGGAETFARIEVIPNSGRIKIRYALADQGWTPRYDLRIKGDGTAALYVRGEVPGSFASYQKRASNGTLADSATAKTVPVSAGNLADLGEFMLASAEDHVHDGAAGYFSALLTNNSSVNLAAGEATLFRSGEYIGRMRFDGISSGRSRRISTAR